MALIYSYPLADEVTNDSWVLGSEMDNGTRVVKNYSVGDLASFSRGFVTLNDVLDNNNVSLLDAYIGQLNLFDANEDDYGSLSLSSSVFEVAAASGNAILNVDNGYLTIYQNGGGYSATIFFTGAADRNYELPDANGTIALTDDLLDYVPYTGATGSINLGSNDIFTTGNARLADDGSVYGSELYIYDSPNGGHAGLACNDNNFMLRRSDLSTMISCDDGDLFTINNGTANATIVNPLTVSRDYTLPNASGTFALTSDIPQDLEQVLAVGNTATAGAFNTLTLTGSAVSILNPSTFAGTTLRRDSLRFTVYDSLEEITVRMDLAVPALTENRSIQLPDADGTVALTVDLPQVANNFANDAAAAIGGIAVGGLYHTAGTVKIRLV
jgi:hypothetical protein